MATIKTLVVSLKANSAQLVKTLSKSRRTIKKWAKDVGGILKSIGKGFGALAAVGIGLFIIAVNKSAAEIDNITKSAGKLNFPIEDYQRFSFIAAKSNIPIDNFGKSMQRMLKTVGDARDGLTTATGAFDQLGLKADDLAKLNPSQQFEAISEAMGNIPTQADKVKVAMDIFGRSGADLLNVFSGDVKGIGEEFDSLGITITKQQAEMVAKYQDAKTTLSTLFTGFTRNVTAEVAPAFTLIIQEITESVIKMGGMKEAAKKFAVFVVRGIAAGVRAFGVFRKVISDASIAIVDLQAKWLAFKSVLTLDNVFDSEGVSKEFDRLFEKRQQIQASISNKGDIERYIESLANKLELSITTPELQDDPNSQTNGIIEAVKRQNELANAANEAAVTLKKVSEAQAWKDIFGKKDITARSNQFDAYAKLVKKNIDSGDSSTGSSINTLKSILETAKNNGGVGFSNNNQFERLDLQGMAEVIRGLESLNAVNGNGAAGSGGDQVEGLIKQAQLSQNVVDKLIQTQQGQKILGKLSIDMTTDAGKVAGEIFAEPEFLQRLQSVVGRVVNDTSRITE